MAIRDVNAYSLPLEFSSIVVESKYEIAGWSLKKKQIESTSCGEPIQSDLRVTGIDVYAPTRCQKILENGNFCFNQACGILKKEGHNIESVINLKNLYAYITFCRFLFLRP